MFFQSMQIASGMQPSHKSISTSTKQGRIYK